MSDFPEILVQQPIDFGHNNGNTRKLVLMNNRALVAWFDEASDLAEPLGDGQNIPEANVAFWKEQAEFAAAEINGGHPFLYRLAIVAVWSNLESHIKDMLANVIEHAPQVRQLEKVKNLKIPLFEYDQLDPSELRWRIVDLLDNDIPPKARRGVGRYESLLHAFNLSGPVPDRLSDAIFELWAVRNNIVHRRGLADKRLIESCPKMGLKTGDKVRITYARLDVYLSAVDLYANLIYLRLLELFGANNDRVAPLVNEFELLFERAIERLANEKEPPDPWSFK